MEFTIRGAELEAKIDGIESLGLLPRAR